MQRARFLILFFLLLAAFELPLLLPSVDVHIIQPFTGVIAAVSGWILHAIGENVTTNGTLIAGPCFAVNVKNGCNAVEATSFLVAAILAFPAAWRERLKAALIGTVMLQILNLARVVSLYSIGCHKPAWFETFHVGVWQTTIFAATILFFMMWARPRTPARAA